MEAGKHTAVLIMGKEATLVADMIGKKLDEHGQREYLRQVVYDEARNEDWVAVAAAANLLAHDVDVGH